MVNYYKLLGVSENASKQQINLAFKKLSLKFHPDKNGGDIYYLELFKEINEAKQVLTNEEKRAEYDFHLNKSIFSNNILLHKDIFKHLFFIKDHHFFINRNLKWATIILGVASIIMFFLIVSNSDIKSPLASNIEKSEVQVNDLKDNSPIVNTIDSGKETEEPAFVAAEDMNKIKISGDDEIRNQKAVLITKKFLKTHSQSKQIQHEAFAKVKSEKGFTKTITIAYTKNNTLLKTQKQIAKRSKETSHLAGFSKVESNKRLSAIAKNKYRKKNNFIQGKRENDLLKKEAKFFKKQFTVSEMSEILRKLNTKKLALNNKINCVKIIVSRNSNVTNAFEIANFLKSKGFIISGRETSNSNEKGIRLYTENSCMVLTIGRL